MASRRAVIRSGLLLAGAALSGCAVKKLSVAGAADTSVPSGRLADLQAQSGGRLGVFVLDTQSGAQFGLNQDQRFGMCSTFKLLLVAAVLHEADHGRLDLAEKVPYGRSDILNNAPATSQFVERGWMTAGDLAQAAQGYSDNTAANLLIRRLGGPDQVTRLFRAMGDQSARLDRYETDMNFVRPGDARDTTTPKSMAQSVARIVAGDVLSGTARQTLIDWMLATGTGLQRLRAGFPSNWRAGDKTGSGLHLDMPNKHNDVAIAWPPGRSLVAVSAYFEAPGHFDSLREQDDQVLAEVGRTVANWIGSFQAAIGPTDGSA